MGAEHRKSTAVVFDGEVAVVTGGGRGLGRTFAETLAAAGATVAVIARSTAELRETVVRIERAGNRAAAFPADVTDKATVATVFAEIGRRLGPVSLLVNNAGVPGPIGPFAEADADEWWQAMQVNLLGPVLCARAVLQGMIARGHGRIVNVASGGGARPIAYFSSYVAAKTALIRFSECLAAEAKPHGIAVFAMGPGTVRTAMSEHSLDSPAGRKWFPWFRRIFDEGLDLPPERPAALLMALASGRMDALSGRFLQPADDIERVLHEANKVVSENLYALRVVALEAAPDPRYAAIAAAAAKSQP